jgi:RNA polymerase sigma factor (sigma-70 family)
MKGDTTHNRQSVLVVDDDPGVLESLNATLEELGAEVTAAATQAEAEGHLRSRSFSLVVTDLQLARGNEGLEVARCAKEQSRESRVVLISGTDLSIVSTRAEEVGVDEMLQKPVTIEALDRILTDLGVEEPAEPPRGSSTGRARLSDEDGQALLRAYVDGDERALNTVVEAYTPMVYSVFLRWFRLGQDDAEDLFQEVMLQLVLKSSQIRNVRMWLLGTSINQAKKRIRRLIRERRLAERYVENLELCAPDDREDVRELVSRGMSLLKPSDRVLLSLIYIQGLSYQEVADLLDRPIGSIGPLRGRALKRLTKSIAALEDPEVLEQSAVA